MARWFWVCAVVLVACDDDGDSPAADAGPNAPSEDEIASWDGETCPAGRALLAPLSPVDVFARGCVQGELLDGPMARWHPPGEGRAPRQTAGFYVAGLEEGVWTRWDIMGAVRAVETWVEGALHGAFREYHSNAEVRIDGGFARGLRHGEWTTYDPLGGLREQGTFEHGHKVGDWTLYWGSEQPQSVHRWVDGAREGPASSFYPDGQPEETGQYTADARTGGQYTAPEAGVFFFTLEGGRGDDPLLQVRWACESEPATLLACNDDADAARAGESQVDVELEAGEVVYVYGSGAGEDGGALEVINVRGDVEPPSRR